MSEIEQLVALLSDDPNSALAETVIDAGADAIERHMPMTSPHAARAATAREVALAMIGAYQRAKP